MARRIRERPLAALWLAMVVMLIGRGIDFRWHATHDEFEGTSQQLEAHWLLWIGVLLVLAVAVVVTRAGLLGFGIRLTLGSTVAYVPVAIWHFIEHANGADPELAHVLLGLGNIGMVAGAVIAIFEARRPPAVGEPLAAGPQDSA